MKKVLKGILLWATAWSVALLLAGIESIVASGIVVLLAWLAVCAMLVYLCITFITPEEFQVLSGGKLIDKFINQNK